MRELQHLPDLSQAAEPPGMPLLRRDAAPAEEVPEVRVRLSLLLRGGVGAARRAPAKGVSRRARGAAGPGHGPDQTAIPANAERLRFGCARHTGGNADARERARFSARDACRRRVCRYNAELAGLSRGGAGVSTAYAGR